MRELAKHITELAAGPENTEKRKLWIAHGSMEDTRPLVICDPENGWNEILNLECESESARTWGISSSQKTVLAGGDGGTTHRVEASP